MIIFGNVDDDMVENDVKINVYNIIFIYRDVTFINENKLMIEIQNKLSTYFMSPIGHILEDCSELMY